MKGSLGRTARRAGSEGLAGGLLYVLGTFLATMACNVPLNDAALAAAALLTIGLCATRNG